MKRISNWSIVGMSGGFVFSLFSGLRYFIFYPDTDKALAYIIIGILIMAVAWLYNKLLNLSNVVGGIEEYLADKK